MKDTRIINVINMVGHQNFDLRTITMGVSLLDCCDTDSKKACQKIYDKICSLGENLVETTDEIGRKYGIPIVNKRVSVTPISLIAANSELTDYTSYAQALDRAGKNIGVDFVGGFSALVQKGFQRSDLHLIHSIPQALASTDIVCSSVNVGSSKVGINMDAVQLMGTTIKDLAEATKDNDSFGCAKLVVFANAVEDNPFMAGSFYGIGEREYAISVGVSGPGVVKHSIENMRGKPFDDLCNEIQRTAFQITRIGQLIGYEVSEKLNVDFNIIDLSLAPTPAIGDSIARILEEMGLEAVGTHGTTCALALLNDAVKKGGMMASTKVGGLSGAFIPVSEDEGMIEAAINGSIDLNKLEAMTSVCSVGLDMIAVPGDTSAETIAAIIADESAIGVVNNKTTAVRIIPVVGKKIGEMVNFGGLLGKAPIMSINNKKSTNFIQRGGQIPAPCHSFKN